MWNGLEKHRDLGLLILRLGLGIGFIYYHGWGKLMAGEETWAALGAKMALVGITFWPVAWGILLVIAETLVSFFVAIGLLFRPSCLFIAIGMSVAWLSHVVSGSGTPGHAFKYVFVLVGLMLIGPGKYSVDQWWANRKQQGSAGDAD